MQVARGRHSGESGRMNFDADMNSESSSSGSDPFGGDGSSAGSSLEGSGDSDNEVGNCHVLVPTQLLPIMLCSLSFLLCANSRATAVLTKLVVFGLDGM